MNSTLIVDPDSLDMMKAMVRANAPSAVLLLLNLAGCWQAHLDYYSGPIIVRPLTSSPPQWLRAAIYQDRLERIIEEHNQHQVEEIATPGEVAIYLAGALQDAPMHTGFIHTYAWATGEVSTKYHGMSQAEYWEALAPCGERPRPIELTDDERRDCLDPLSAWLRRAVVKGRKKSNPASILFEKWSGIDK